MSTDSDSFTRYARAEKDFCDKAGEILARVIQEIEAKHHVAIAEVRVTMDRAGANAWSLANCVLVRELATPAATKAIADGKPIASCAPGAGIASKVHTSAA